MLFSAGKLQELRKEALEKELALPGVEHVPYDKIAANPLGPTAIRSHFHTMTS